MKIELSKTLVEFTPEADYEKTMLEGLWRMLVDCARFNQKLVPVGEYVPAKNNTARFAVEGETIFTSLRFSTGGNARAKVLNPSLCRHSRDLRPTPALGP